MLGVSGYYSDTGFMAQGLRGDQYINVERLPIGRQVFRLPGVSP